MIRLLFVPMCRDEEGRFRPCHTIFPPLVPSFINPHYFFWSCVCPTNHKKNFGFLSFTGEYTYLFTQKNTVDLTKSEYLEFIVTPLSNNVLW